MLYVACYFLAVLQCTSTDSGGQLFSANVHLESALYTERQIASLLTKYIENESAKLTNDEVHTSRKLKLEKLKSLTENHLKHNERSLEDIEGFLSNPINSFLFIKRLVEWGKDVKPLISKQTKDSNVKEILKLSKVLPTQPDLNGAVYSINRLQDFYFLNFSDVANGNLMGVKSPRLSMEDCIILGHISYDSQDLYHAAMWFSIALERINTLNETIHKQEKVDNDETMMSSTDLKNKTIEILDNLIQSYFPLGNITKVIALLDKIIEIDPKNYKANNNKGYLLNMMKKPNPDILRTMDTLPEFNINRHGYISYEEFLTYTALCRGEKKDQPKDKKTHILLKEQLGLKCRLSHNNNPKLILQPAKEEILSTDPWIVVYHDVISDSEIDQLKSVSSEMIDLIKADKKLKYYISKNVRIVKNTWLYGHESPVINKINQRIEAITGLSMDSAEPLQAANYGIGGHYVPHCDQKLCDPKKPDEKVLDGARDRIATFMIYLTDVQEGGATVFTDIGISIKPVKATAAFWYNLRKNGSGDLLTRHAACPVLLGNKWVANKWIHEEGQEFRRPCGTRPQD